MRKRFVSPLSRGKRSTLFYSYIIVAAGFIIQGLGLGTLNTFGVFFTPLLNEFGWSRASISGASSLTFLLSGFLSIIVGSLNDRFGPRIIMAVSGLFLGLGYLLMSQVGAIWQLYLFFGIVVGIGMSAIDLIPLSTAARWFSRKRGMMTGIVKVGTGAGQLVIPLVASGLIIAYGWRNSYIIIGVVVLVTIVAVAQFLRRDPGQMRLAPDTGREPSSDGLDAVEEGLSFYEAVHTRQFWMVCAINLTIFLCALTITVHIVPHAIDAGISATNSAAILSTIGGVSMVGRLVMGSASDRIGNRRSITVCFLLLVAGLLWLQIASELWMLYLFAVVHGFAHGGLFTLISTLLAELFGTSSHGALFGIALFSGTIGGAIGPLLAGRIFDVTSGYSLTFWILAAFGILGLGLISLLKPVGQDRRTVRCGAGRNEVG